MSEHEISTRHRRLYDEYHELWAVLRLFLTCWQAECPERAGSLLAEYASAREDRLEMEEQSYKAELNRKAGITK